MCPFKDKNLAGLFLFPKKISKGLKYKIKKF